MTLEPDRRAALLAAQLGALARAGWPAEAADAVAGTFPGGASLVAADGAVAWVLLDDEAERRVGGAMALAARAGARSLHLLVTDADAATIVARRAGCFVDGPTVWHVDGVHRQPATAAPPAIDAAPAPEAELYRPVLVAAGLTPVVEDGQLKGELRGLEVARVVVDADGGAHVEAGVGRFDREVSDMMFAHLAETDALARAVDAVAAVRRPGAEHHPVAKLVPERWLRSVLVDHPQLVGAAELVPVGSALPRRNLLETGIASAVGTDLEGRELVVTCSTGVDLELVPGAADDRLAHAPDARLVLAVPARDALPVTAALAARLVAPAEVVTVGDDWPSLGGGG